MRIVLADDHDLVREGLRRVVDRHPDLEIVGEVADGNALLELLATTPADVLVMDISMPGPGFLKTLDHIKEGWPDLPVLVVSMHPEEEWAVQALKAGASGYLSKRRTSDELVQAIRRVQSGGLYVTDALAEGLAARLVRSTSGPAHESLSRREFEVLCLLGGGLMVKKVAAQLGLSPRTVSTYRSRILEKLELRTTADLIRYVTEHGLTL